MGKHGRLLVSLIAVHINTASFYIRPGIDKNKDLEKMQCELSYIIKIWQGMIDFYSIYFLKYLQFGKVWLKKKNFLDHDSRNVWQNMCLSKYPSVCGCKYKVWEGKIMGFIQKLTFSFANQLTVYSDILYMFCWR